MQRYPRYQHTLHSNNILISWKQSIESVWV